MRGTHVNNGSKKDRKLRTQWGQNKGQEPICILLSKHRTKINSVLNQSTTTATIELGLNIFIHISQLQ